MVLIMNLGTLFVVFTLHALMYVALAFIKLFTANGKLGCEKLNRSLTKILFWTQPINFLGPSYMSISFAVLLNTKTSLKWDSWAMRLNNICLIYFAICLIVYPVWLLFILFKNYDKLDSPDLKKYGDVFDDINKDNKFSVIIPTFNLVRRLLLSCLLVFLTS
jgi:hypothetical protein